MSLRLQCVRATMWFAFVLGQWMAAAGSVRVLRVAVCISMSGTAGCGPGDLPAFANPPPEDAGERDADHDHDGYDEDTDGGAGESRVHD